MGTSRITNGPEAYIYGRGYQAYHTDFPEQFKSQDVTVSTAAGVPTIISVIKGRRGGIFDQTADTIVCQQGMANEKNIQL